MATSSRRQKIKGLLQQLQFKSLASHNATKDATAHTPSSDSVDAPPRDDQAGVVGGITVLIMAVPLLLLTGLTLFNSRLSQADHDLAWAATSAARAGANCVNLTPAESLPVGSAAREASGATATVKEPCTLREVGLIVETTVRSLLLDNRRLFCLNTNATGMVVEYLDYEGDLIYAYGIGSVLLNTQFWPDRGADAAGVTLDDIFGNPDATDPDDRNPDPDALDAPFFPLQPSERQDFAGNTLSLRSPASNFGTGFESTMLDPLGADEPVGQIQVHLLCDYSQGANLRLAQCAALSRNPGRRCDVAEGVGSFLAQASAREASAAAVVPLFEGGVPA